MKASSVIETAKTNLEKANTKLATARDKQRMLSDKNKELFIERASPGLPSRKLNAPSKSKTSRKTKKKKTHLDFFR